MKSVHELIPINEVINKVYILNLIRYKMKRRCNRLKYISWNSHLFFELNLNSNIVSL